MTALFDSIGSLLTLWLLGWLFLSLPILLCYPLIRPILLARHPALGSKLLLALLSAPFLVSLLASVMLFIPLVENTMVSAHCHSNCGPHSPLSNSPWLIWPGACAGALVLAGICRRLLRNLKSSRQLMRQLSAVSIDRGNWQLIPECHCLVFALGWWSPRIFITEGLMKRCRPGDIEIILAHEQAHARRKDNIRLLLGKLFLLPIPNRFTAPLMNDLTLLTESACDFSAARAYSPLDIAETLLHVQKLVPAGHPQQGRLAFTGSEVELRIRALLNPTMPERHYPGLTSLLSLGLLLLLTLAMLDPMHHGFEWLVHKLSN